jgi:hypothetical protein
VPDMLSKRKGVILFTGSHFSSVWPGEVRHARPGASASARPRSARNSRGLYQCGWAN